MYIAWSRERMARHEDYRIAENVKEASVLWYTTHNTSTSPHTTRTVPLNMCCRSENNMDHIALSIITDVIFWISVCIIVLDANRAWRINEQIFREP